jgi:RNA polymerase sigma-70 factor (ECF subfamily)
VAPHTDSEEASDEARLLARIGAGDREAFRLLYAAYSGPLFSFAVRLVGNVGEAEELLQDSFVKIWRNAASFDARKSKPFTWAVTVTRRTCIDHLRKRSRLPIADPVPVDSIPSDGGRASDPTRRAAEGREDSERVRSAMAGSNENQRRALELALFSELSHTEIARRLEQPVGTVKSWIRKGLLDLRANLANSPP